MNTPIPSNVSFPITGVEGSLTGETLNWKNLSTKKNGKTVHYGASVACKSGKRPVQRDVHRGDRPRRRAAVGHRERHAEVQLI